MIIFTLERRVVLKISLLVLTEVKPLCISLFFIWKGYNQSEIGFVGGDWNISSFRNEIAF